MIDVKDLRKSFGELEVLKGVSQHIDKGERVVLIGPSGSGKSTFLRCLNLLEEPSGGQIIFEGQDITDPKIDINKIRQKMGMVFQHFNLFPNMTILKNITLAPVRTGLMTKEAAEKEARELLKRVGLEDKADGYPAQLSGGQKQRIAIVRALCMHPEVMLFDARNGIRAGSGGPGAVHGRRGDRRGRDAGGSVRGAEGKADAGVFE